MTFPAGAELLFALAPLVLLLLVLYWVVRLAVAAGIRSALPAVLEDVRGDRG